MTTVQLVERAAARVCREAGARVAISVVSRAMNVDVPLADTGEWIARLPLWQGVQAAVDTTLVSPVARAASNHMPIVSPAQRLNRQRNANASTHTRSLRSRAVANWLCSPWKLVAGSARRPWPFYGSFGSCARVPPRGCARPCSVPPAPLDGLVSLTGTSRHSCCRSSPCCQTSSVRGSSSPCAPCRTLITSCAPSRPTSLPALRMAHDDAVWRCLFALLGEETNVDLEVAAARRLACMGAHRVCGFRTRGPSRSTAEVGSHSCNLRTTGPKGHQPRSQPCL